MPVYEIDDVLAGFKAISANIDASPQPALAHRYAWPADNSLDLVTFPFIIWAEALNIQNGFTPGAPGAFWHRWTAEGLLCLANGPLTRQAAQASAEVKHQPWILAVAKILDQNRSVNGTAFDIGTAGGPLFTYRIANIGWDETHQFWGIRFEVPILQEQSSI